MTDDDIFKEEFRLISSYIGGVHARHISCKTSRSLLQSVNSPKMVRSKCLQRSSGDVVHGKALFQCYFVTPVFDEPKQHAQHSLRNPNDINQIAHQDCCEA